MAANWEFMRSWLLDCFPDEHDQEVIESLTNSELIDAIEKYFDGGVEAWKLTEEIS